ncbi:MAG: hypothetical protein ABJA66_00070 [Actinomycetota bacterium]
MKNFFWIIVLNMLLTLGIFAQCETAPTIETTGKILKELKLKKANSNSAEAEIGLFVRASVKGASWQKKGAEAAVLTVFVDGKYNQDAILFAGEKVFEYQMLLGKYNFYEHQITIVLNKAHSAPNAGKVTIHAVFSTVFEDVIAAAKTAGRSVPAYIATVNAPLIYLRRETIDKFSDIPLLTYYEIFDEPEKVKKIRYTTIFTNEDGGTQSAALMARWGRMTDIEWVYEIRVRESGEIISEIYQGANHETKDFKGRRLGSHPLILDATVNNNFADSGCSALRVSATLVEADLSGRSRETEMEAFPWIYRIMAEEAIREGRVNREKLDANTIADPREYLYAEIYGELKNAAIALEAERPDGRTISSDSGNNWWRMNRSGFVRIALRLGPEFSNRLPSALALRCYAVSAAAADQESSCENINLIKVVRLDQNYFPQEIKIEAKPQNIKFGETIVFVMPPGKKS